MKILSKKKVRRAIHKKALLAISITPFIHASEQYPSGLTSQLHKSHAAISMPLGIKSDGFMRLSPCRLDLFSAVDEFTPDIHAHNEEHQKKDAAQDAAKTMLDFFQRINKYASITYERTEPPVKKRKTDAGCKPAFSAYQPPSLPAPAQSLADEIAAKKRKDKNSVSAVARRSSSSSSSAGMQEPPIIRELKRDQLQLFLYSKQYEIALERLKKYAPTTKLGEFNSADQQCIQLILTQIIEKQNDELARAQSSHQELVGFTAGSDTQNPIARFNARTVTIKNFNKEAIERNETYIKNLLMAPISQIRPILENALYTITGRIAAKTGEKTDESHHGTLSTIHSIMQQVRITSAGEKFEQKPEDMEME